MPTLRELQGQNFRSEAVSPTGRPTAAVSPVQTQATKEIDLMARDIEKLTVGATNIAKAAIQTSEYADKVRASDTYNNFIKGMHEIDNHFQNKLSGGQALTVQDYKDKKDWQESFFVDITTNGIQEGDETNLIFKESFLRPANEFLFKTSSNDTIKQFERGKLEKKSRDFNEATVLKQDNRVENIQTKIDEANILGIPNYDKQIYGAVATSTIENWTAINNQEIVDAVGNGTENLLLDKYFGNYLKYDKDNNMVSTDMRIDDTASTRMKNSFNNKINGVKKSLAKKTTKLNDNLSIAFSNMDTNTMSSTDATTVVNRALDTVVGLMKVQPDKDFGSEYDIVTKMSMKAEEIRMLESIKASIDSGDADLDQILSTPYKFDVELRQIAKGVPPVKATVNIKTETIVGYINAKNDELYSKIKNSEFSASDSSVFGVNIATIKDSGLPSSTAKKIESNEESFYNNGFSAANTVDEFMNAFTINSSYENQREPNNITIFNDDGTKVIGGYYQQLKAQQKEDDTITDEYILGRLKQRAYGLSAEKRTANHETRLAKSIGYSDEEFDDYVSGYVTGETQPVSGAIGVLVQLSSGKQPRTIAEFQDFAKSKTMEIDPSAVPLWGDSLTMINPTPKTSNNNVRTNLKKLLGEDLAKFAGVETEDIDDIVDEGNTFRVYQYVGIRGQVQTVVNYYDGNVLANSALYSADELSTGIREHKIGK